MSFKRRMKRNKKQAKKSEHKAALREVREKVYDPTNPRPYQLAKDKLRKQYGYKIV